MKDKLLNWKTGFPYDVTKVARIAPDSSMAAVKIASLKVMGPKWTPELYAALEELRIVKRRLFVDFFLYQIDGEIVSPELLDKEIAASVQEISGSDLAPYLSPDTSDLLGMEKDFQEIKLPETELEYLGPELEVSIGVDFLEFDS